MSFADALQFFLGFLAVALPVFGFLGWGIWAIHANERDEPGRERGLSALRTLVMSVPAGAAVMATAVVGDPQHLWQTLVSLAFAAGIVALIGWFTTQNVSGPFIAALGFHAGFSTMSLAVVAVTPMETGWEGLFYVFVLVGGIVPFALAALAVVRVRVRAARRSVPGMDAVLAPNVENAVFDR